VKAPKIINNISSKLIIIYISSTQIFIIFPLPSFAQPVSSDKFVLSAVERALIKMGNQQIEIIAQGSWISGQNYKDPRFQQILTGAIDHDMRVFFEHKMYCLNRPSRCGKAFA
jgi:hypothetical protein